VTSTNVRIVEAALRTLRSKGFAGASARAIAHEGDFNQALIFYHHGSVRNVLLAVLDLISERRMSDYRTAFERAGSTTELVALARTIHADDVDRGYITVLGEMVSGAATDPDLGKEVAARIEPWIEMVEQKITELLKGTPFSALASPQDLAFGLVAAYFGVDMLSHLRGDQSRAESLLELAARLSSLADAFMPAQPEETP
jgi:AcrR family transcriptional regulator